MQFFSLTFRKTVLVFLAALCSYYLIMGIVGLCSCQTASGAGTVGGVLGAIAENTSGFITSLVSRGIISPAEGLAWGHFMDTTTTAVTVATDLAKTAQQLAHHAQESAATAQLTGGGVGVAAIASDQIHKVLATKAAVAQIPDPPPAKV